MVQGTESSNIVSAIAGLNVMEDNVIALLESLIHSIRNPYARLPNTEASELS